jgi:hypothetical protein
VTEKELADLERRLPPLHHLRLPAMASYLESITHTQPLTGQLQGEVLSVAAKIRELAEKLAA